MPARRGLSFKAVTGKPIQVSPGRRGNSIDFEQFHPEAQWRREFLGMVTSQSRRARAAEAVDAEDAKRMEGKERQGTVYPRDFLEQLRRGNAKRIGSLGEHCSKCYRAAQKCLKSADLANSEREQFRRMGRNDLRD